MKLVCPIRGILNVEKYSKNGLSFTEEYQRIELVKFLLNKGYEKKDFIFEHNINFGSGGKNSLRIDLVLKINSKFLICCEVKKDNNKKQSAIKHQLEPAMKLLNSTYGVYFDGEDNELIYKSEIYSIDKLPRKGSNFDQKNISIFDLRPINNIENLYKKLDQLVHNLGLSKDERYTGIFQILLAKYYDEKFNIKNLKFQINDYFSENFQSLYKNSLAYYSTKTQLKLEKELILEDKIIKKIVNLLQEYSFINSDLGVIQSFFMKFGAKMIQKDLAQYYTPITMVKFIASIIDLKPNQFVIDPAGGSGDFLVGILEKYKSNINDYKENMFMWDKSKDACKVAFINMVLHGDGRTNIELKDSIEKYKDNNNEFDFVITNPPFGEKTKWEGDDEILKKYEVSEIKKGHQLGILFIERSLKLLKNGGNLIIILPSGYLDNSSYLDVRKYIFKNFKVLGCISLPVGVFRGSNANAKANILIIKKSKNVKENYNIFMDAAKKLGFAYNTTLQSPVYKLDDVGEFIRDDNNNKLLDNELVDISERFMQFAYDNNLSGFSKLNRNLEYNFSSKDEIFKRDNLIIKPEFHLNLYKVHLNKNKNFTTLKDLKDRYKISLIKKTEQKPIESSNNYIYLETSDVGMGNYSLNNLKRGWEIKKISRAKQWVKNNDILISYLLGCYKSFCIISNEKENIVATTGFYVIRIPDEKIRLSFYKFLFSNSFRLQYEAFSSGTINVNVSLEYIWNLNFRILDEVELNEVRDLLRSIDKYKTISNRLYS